MMLTCDKFAQSELMHSQKVFRWGCDECKNLAIFHLNAYGIYVNHKFLLGFALQLYAICDLLFLYEVSIIMGYLYVLIV